MKANVGISLASAAVLALLMSGCTSGGAEPSAPVETSATGAPAETTATQTPVPSASASDDDSTDGASDGDVPSASGAWTYAVDGEGDSEKRTAQTESESSALIVSVSELNGRQVHLQSDAFETGVCALTCNALLEIDGTAIESRWSEIEGESGALSTRQAKEILELVLDGATTLTVSFPDGALETVSGETSFTFEVAGLDEWIDD
ncbi:hypothetical protein [Humidisolicoccus flavus]|uniref:hypothetical protein n=1 Tax=Humidisolicoccus flavus TaxID=3111414 RepID=UPI00324EE462